MSLDYTSTDKPSYTGASGHDVSNSGVSSSSDGFGSVDEETHQNAAQGTKKACSVSLVIPFVTGRADYYGCPLSANITPQHKGLYFKALEHEIALSGPDIAQLGQRVDAVSFDLGSIGTVEANNLRMLGRALRESLPLTPQPFVSAEMDPGLLSTAMIDELKKLGLSLLRVHYLTSDDRLLAHMERPNTDLELKKTEIVLDSAGFHHLDMQVMYGLAGQNTTSIERTVRDALLFDGVEHVTLVPASARWAGTVDEITACYRAAVDVLDEHGFKAYTPLCFTRNQSVGDQDRNLQQQTPTIGKDGLRFGVRIPFEQRRFASSGIVGLGSSAISCNDSLMWQNISDPHAYGASGGDPSSITAQVIEMSEELVAARRVLEQLYLLESVSTASIDGLATNLREHHPGWSAAAQASTATPDTTISERLLEDGLLEEVAPAGVRLSPAGRAHYERVFSCIIGG